MPLHCPIATSGKAAPSPKLSARQLSACAPYLLPITSDGPRIQPDGYFSAFRPKDPESCAGLSNWYELDTRHNPALREEGRGSL